MLWLEIQISVQFGKDRLQKSVVTKNVALALALCYVWEMEEEAALKTELSFNWMNSPLFQLILWSNAENYSHYVKSTPLELLRSK